MLKHNFNYYNNKSIYKIIIVFLFNFIFFILIFILNFKNSKKIGIVGVRHEANIGNNLLKYAMSIKLSELGYIPYIIGTVWDKYNNIEFINSTTNLIIIRNDFSEIKMNDYDFLIVNSDQTWKKFDKNFYDYGFLRFAENWTTPRFIYGASLGIDYWPFSKNVDNLAKKYLKKFRGISVREKESINLINKHLGIRPEIVLDPTLLIDKNYYQKLIIGFKGNKTQNNKYIFSYIISNCEYTKDLIRNSSKILNLEYYYFPLNNQSNVVNFLYHLINSECVVTNSYHGTIFSIIFNKPFISVYTKKGKSRFSSLDFLVNINKRLILKGKKPNYKLLIQPLNINYKILNIMKEKSINFLLKNLQKA